MTKFNSVFSVELLEYLAIRQKTLAPESYRIAHYVLTDFDRYFTGCGVSNKTVTEDLVNGWIQHLRSSNHSKTVSDKVSCLRGFLEYLRYCGITVFVPKCPKYQEDYVPYIFSDSDMETIFRAADAVEPKISRATIRSMQFELPMVLRLLLRLRITARRSVGFTYGRCELRARDAPVAATQKQEAAHCADARVAYGNADAILCCNGYF